MRRAACARRRSDRRGAQRLIRMRRQHDLVEAAGLAVRGDDLDPRVVSPDRSHAQTEMNLAAQAFQHRRHVRVGAALDGLQRCRRRPSMPWRSKKRIPYAAGKSKRAPAARPERGRERHQEVTAEASRVPALVDVDRGSSLEAPVRRVLPSAVRSQRTTSVRSERKRASASRRPCANGLRPDHSSPHSPQLAGRHLRAASPHAGLTKQAAEDG